MIFDSLTNCENYYGVHKNFKEAFDFIRKAVNENLPVGKYELSGAELFASVQEYDTKKEAECRAESHKKYIDIQYIIDGVEVMDVFDIKKAESSEGYSEEKDVEFFKDLKTASRCIVTKGEYGIFMPHDVHKPGMALNDNPAPVKKIVVKVEV